MDERQPQNRSRNTYLVFIGAGLFLLLHRIIHNPGVLVALFMVLLGIYSLRAGMQKKGYVLLGVGTFIIISNQFVFVLSLFLLSIGYFYIRSKRVHGHTTFIQKTKIVESLKRDKEPWVLRSMSLWYAIAELNLDFSLAIPEEKETTLVLQGIVGDIDIFIPEDWGLSIESSLMFGQLDVAHEREAGAMNKIFWQSPGYEASEQRVKLIVSYVVGDIDIRMI